MGGEIGVIAGGFTEGERLDKSALDEDSNGVVNGSERNLREDSTHPLVDFLCCRVVLRIYQDLSYGEPLSSHTNP